MADYSQQDFTSTYEELLSIVESSTTKWHPRTSTEADPGVVILKAMAFLEDKANYRFDMSLNQAFLDGVSDEQSAYELLKELGYLMKSARAATGEVSLLPNASSWPKEEATNNYSAVEIPLFTQLTDATGTVKFFTTQTFSVTSTASLPTAYTLPVMAGEPFQIVKDGASYFTLMDFDERGRLYLGKSGLAQNGVFLLTQVDYTDSSGNAEQLLVKDWEYLDYAILKPSGYWYTVETADDGEMFIQLPSNFATLLANKRLVVYATYTSGASSNVARGIVSRFVNSAQYSDYFAVSQPVAFYTGQDRESIDSAVKHYYESKDVCDALVTSSDYVAALKNLLIYNMAQEQKYVQGDYYLDNAIVSTAADRKTKVLTAAYGTQYQLFVPDTTEPFYQVDVTPLTHLAPVDSDASQPGDADYAYASTFRRPEDATDFNEAFEADFNSQLQDNVAAAVELNITKNFTSSDNPKLPLSRLLAVAVPDITVRLSNYTVAAASDLRTKIKQYLYSAYSSRNLTAGKPLDEQKIIEDIQALSPLITSVTLPALDYTIYSSYTPVDGEDVQISIEPTFDANGTPSSELASDSLVQNLQEEILARSVLQGSVPLYRYYNRENTKTKATAVSAYGSSAVSSAPVIPVPLNAISYNVVSSTPRDVSIAFSSFPAFVAEWGSALAPLKDYPDYKYGIALRSPNELVQFRKPKRVITKTFGYGMKYSFTRLKPFPTGVATSELAGTIAAGSVIPYDLSTRIVISDSFGLDDRYFEEDTSYSSTDYTKWKFKSGISNILGSSYTFTSSCQCYTGTILKLPSDAPQGYAPGSNFTVSNTYYSYEPVYVSDGSEYALQQGESLVILSASTGAAQITLGPGAVIQPSGLTLYATNANSANILTTTQSISVLKNDTATFGTDFVYYLSVQSTASAVEGTYTLDEGELLVIADKAITEYVTFGPGSEITIPDGSELTPGKLLSLQDIARDMFNVLPATISVKSYDFVTVGYEGAVLFTDSPSEDSLYRSISTAWSTLPASALACLGPVPGLASSTTLADWHFDNTITRFIDFNESGWQVRRCCLLQTDSSGAVSIQSSTNNPLNFTISDVTIGGEGSGVTSAYISSSVPFRRLVGSDSSSLASDAVVSAGSISTVTSGTGVTSKQVSLYSRTYEVTEEEVTSLCSIGLPAPKALNASEYLLYFASDSPISMDAIITAALKSGSGSVAGSSLQWSSSGAATVSAADFARGVVLSYSFDNPASLSASLTLELTTDSPLPVGTVFTVSAFSAVADYSAELGIKLTASSFDTLLHTLQNGEHRFLPTLYPDESFVYPLSASSFFNSAHPANRYTFPYLQLDDKMIKIVPLRGY